MPVRKTTSRSEDNTASPPHNEVDQYMVDLFLLGRSNPYDRIHEHHLAAHFDEALAIAYRRWLCFLAIWAGVLAITQIVWLCARWLNTPTSERVAILALAGMIVGTLLVARIFLPGAIKAGLYVVRLLDDPSSFRTEPVPPGRWPEIPSLPHDTAMEIGQQLSVKWHSLVGLPAPDTDDLIWADLVQYVLLRARNAQAERAQLGVDQ